MPRTGIDSPEWLDKLPSDASIITLRNKLIIMEGIQTTMEARAEMTFEEILILCCGYKARFESSYGDGFFEIVFNGVCELAIRSMGEERVNEAMRGFYHRTTKSYFSDKYLSNKRTATKSAIKVIDLCVNYYGSCAYALPFYGIEQ